MSMPRDDGLGLLRGMAMAALVGLPVLCVLFYCLGAVAGVLIMFGCRTGLPVDAV